MEDKITTRNILDKHIKKWQALIETLPYPVSVHDTEFNVVMANKKFIDVCGRADVTGLKCYDLIHCQEKRVEGCPMSKTLKSGNPERAELYEPTLKKYLLVQTSPIFIEENLVGITHSVTDITELKQSETSYIELTEVLGTSLNEVKKRELLLQKGKDAFLNMLEDINESYRELEELFMSTVRAMANAIDAKSHWTRGHSERVMVYAEQIAHEMGLDENDTKNLRLAALLHDVGKIGTYDYLLDRPKKLTDEEVEIIRKHPAQGAEILKGIKQLKDIIPLIRHHHERIDGKGYPDKLKGDEIPLGARILHVSDSFDSMISDRPYRSAPGSEYAISELKRYSGTQFDRQVVEAFLRVLSKEVVV
ncbi:MAG: HD domain-containing protein [Nitrospirae bacterium]|nr:HD domain-containing protein [Nitrospirota bacterium]